VCVPRYTDWVLWYGAKKNPAFNQFKAIRSLLLVQAEDKLSTLIFFYARSPVVFRAPRRHRHRHRRRLIPLCAD